MRVTEKMILAVFVISGAFAAEPELQHIAVNLSPSADGASVLCYLVTSLVIH